MFSKNRWLFGGITSLLAIVFLFPFQAKATHRPPITVRIMGSDLKEQSQFNVPSANNAGGASIAIADLGSDGVSEIIVGAGLGNEPRVRVLRKDGSEIGSFLAYAPTMGIGVNVVACDFDGDGSREIITAPARGGGPHVRPFNEMGEPQGEGFFAYSATFRGGVNLACSDLDGDGVAELVTLPAVGGGPHVRIWKKNGIEIDLFKEFFAFDSSDARGLVGVIDNQKLIIATEHASTTNIKTYQIESNPVLIGEQEMTIDARGVTSLFVHQGALKMTTAGEANIIDVSTGKKIPVMSPFDSVVAASGVFNQVGVSEIVVVPSRPVFGGKPEGKSIVVDVSDQRLYAYENGVLANTFLVSTGREPWPTPLGETKVLAKIWKVDYRWNYSQNPAWNYDLGLVPYNLRIFPHIYIHYAYWHNNFGHPMSHGCVNAALENAKWIYEWGEEGIPVTVQA